MVYCDNCGAQMGKVLLPVYQRTSRKVTVLGMDVNVEYQGRFCPRCGEELFDDDIEASVFTKAKSIYRRMLGLLSPEEVKKLLKSQSVETLEKRTGIAARKILGASMGGLLSKEEDTLLRAAA